MTAHDPGGKVRNRRTPAGAEIGRKMAQWCDDAEPKARLLAPELPPRCASCAFRAGEHLANGSPETQMTALKCVIEGSPFHCHDHNRPDWLCCGWVMMMLSREKDEPFGKMPWDFVTGADDASPHPTDTSRKSGDE